MPKSRELLFKLWLAGFIIAALATATLVALINPDTMKDAIAIAIVCLTGSIFVVMSGASESKFADAVVYFIRTLGSSSGATAPPALFPKWWRLFSFLLPRSVRERVYEPCLEELKEEYIRAAPEWVGKWPRRWLLICFTVKTAAMVIMCLWEALGDKGRRVLVALFVAMVGPGAAEFLKTWLATKFGRLP